MVKNIGSLDRVIRLLIGVGLLTLVFTVPPTWWGMSGLIPLATAFTGMCPLYAMVGLATRHEEEDVTDRLLHL